MKAKINVGCPYADGDVDLPEGYVVKKRGKVKDGDKVFNVHSKVFHNPEKLGGLVKDYWLVITKE